MTDQTSTQPIQHSIEIRSTESGKSVLLVTVWVEDGVAKMKGDASLISELQEGLFDNVRNKLVMPDDGQSFLALLPVIYDNPYFFAVEIKLA